MDQIVAIAKALSDPARVRALMMLRDGELCVCQVIAVLGMSPSNVSRHMSLLRDAGLVRQRKDGRWHYYRLAAGAGTPPAVRRALAMTQRAVQDDPTIAADAAALRRSSAATLTQISTCCYRPRRGSARQTTRTRRTSA